MRPDQAPEVLTDVQLARELAVTAGRLLMDLRAEGQNQGLSGKALGKEGDLRSNELLLKALDEARPGDAVLSEESVDSPARLTAERVWIIDPLDGTREYGMASRTDWAVHVALWSAKAGSQGAIESAAVALPALDQVLVSSPPTPTPSASGGERVRTLVSASRPPAWLPALDKLVPLELIPMGSAGAKAMAVLRGEADAYLHDGGQWEWDSAAPVGVVLGAGYHASRLDGTPLMYNRPHPYLPDLVISRPELADRLIDALKEIGARS